MFSRSKPLLNFGTGLLIGSSITVALFAAMEGSDGRLSHDMLLAAFVALVLAIVLKVAAKSRPRRTRGRSLPTVRLHDATAGTGWTVERPAAATTPAASTSSKDNEATRDARASETLSDLTVLHRDAEASADGETRRL
jgi:hypothetical protein